MPRKLPMPHDALRKVADAVSAYYGESISTSPLPDDALAAFRAATALQEAAYGLTEWQKVLAVIAGDDKMSSQIGALVGTEVGGRVITARELRDDFVTQVMYGLNGENDGLRITIAVFDQIYQPIDSSFSAIKVSHTTSLWF